MCSSFLSGPPSVGVLRSLALSWVIIYQLLALSSFQGSFTHIWGPNDRSGHELPVEAEEIQDSECLAEAQIHLGELGASLI